MQATLNSSGLFIYAGISSETDLASYLTEGLFMASQDPNAEVSLMDPETRSNVANQVVVAYFANSADAQSALDDLVYEGYEPRQIGAAFRGRGALPHAAATLDEEEIGSKAVRRAVDSDTVGSGPASDTRAVTPSGLSTGSGSVISGAGRPGPIPGSDIPHHRSISRVAGTSPTVRSPLPATGGIHEPSHRHEEDDSWWQKIKNFFSGDTSVEVRNKGVANATSMNYGTGEGHLATLPDDSDYVYSGSAFESAFSGMGVSQSHARSLVGDLQSGGAIVSVDATGRVEDAERILERNNGRVRYETIAEVTQWSDVPGERVRVFGQLSGAYPTYLTGSDIPRRKAS